jgi:shikimate dehydrogenase
MTQRVGIIGWPLTFTLSPAMHNAAFKALGMDWQYDAMAIPPDIVRYGLREPAQHGYVGINVTIPHKETVLRYVKPDDTARAIGAVNTVDLRTDAGYNTDVTGFIGDLKAHGVALKGARVIVLGAGGAARAAVYGLGLEGASIGVVNRTPERALKMVADLSLYQLTLDARAVTLADAVASGVDLIVNCTSVGMIPDVDANPWDASVPFPQGATVYDMVYRPSVTALMRQAEAHGGRAIGGLGMLVRQGADAFRIWTGIDAPLDVMAAAARQALAEAEGR